MGNLADIPATWSDDITQLETTDPVEGGPNGVDNLPHRQLASRTAWLKTQIESIVTACAEFAAKVHSHAIGDVSGLQNALDQKSATTHTHTPASLGAAAAAHTHTPASLGAAASSHTHTGAEITFVEGSATYRLSIVSGVLTQTRIS